MTYRLRSYLALVAAFAVPFGVYVASLRPGVDYWDTGELQTVPYILGIAHPTGFPLYVLAGWVWSHLIPLGDPAYRMNAFSAFGMATAAATVTAVLLELALEPVFAAGAALVFAFARVPWEHATRADVHAVALAAVGAAFWGVLRWRRTGSPRALYAGAAASAAALGVHSGTILAVPGALLAACSRRPSRRQWTTAAVLGIGMVAAVYAYLPLRSATVWAQRRDPTLQLGVAPGRPFWDNDHPSTAAGFWAEVGGGQFGAGTALARIVEPQVWADVPARYGRSAVGDLAAGVLLIALAGAVALARRAPAVAAGLGGTMLPVLFVLAYPAESDPERYFLPSYWAIAVCLGVGAGSLARAGLDAPPPGIVALVGTLFACVAAGNVYAGRDAFAQRFDRPAQAFIERVAAATPPDAILVTPWTYATPLAYGAYVERRLARRIVLTGWPSDYPAADYRRWLRGRPIVVISDEPAARLTGMTVHDLDTRRSPHLYALDGLP